MNIYLVGYRGTGKSSVAPILAKQLGDPWQAVDMDAIIEDRSRKSIADIFAKEKKRGFADVSEACWRSYNERFSGCLDGGWRGSVPRIERS